MEKEKLVNEIQELSCAENLDQWKWAMAVKISTGTELTGFEDNIATSDTFAEAVMYEKDIAKLRKVRNILK